MSLRAPRLSLWPNTLAKFWGLHALALATAAAVAVLLRVQHPLLLPLAASNAALATVLYRSREDANVALASTAALYFGAHAAVLSLWRLMPVAVLWRLRGWYMLLAVGSFSFATKAALKDRLFEGDGSMRAAEADTDAGSAIPLLVFVNRQSGAKVGALVGAALDEAARQAATTGQVLQVIDVSLTPPAEALLAFSSKHSSPFRVLVAGGDGTASWVLDAIEESQLRAWDGAPYRPAVGLLPLGTGNDLARVLGWGKAFRFDALGERLKMLDASRVSLVDRWRVEGQMPEGVRSRAMTNYLSIGVDAKAALCWARLAHAAPYLFRLRLLNKLWYIICGVPEFFQHSYRDLSQRCELRCDGETIEIPASIEGLMVLNSPSYGGGSDLWDERRAAPLRASARHFQSGRAQPLRMDDGLIEVVGVTDVVHLATSLGGLSSGTRLCQGRNISLAVRDGGVPLQIDGEPFNVDAAAASTSHADTPPDGFEAFDVTIRRDGRARMLAAPLAGTQARGSAFAAIEGALKARAISTAQRDALLDALNTS